MKERDVKYLISKVKALPESPGVYLMKGHEGQIIYVGKSKNLKNRVSQYFHNSPKESKKLQRLMKSIFDFEIIYTDTEFEALVLEARLIQEAHPEYNSMVKRYKNYVYLKLTTQEKYPRFQIAKEADEDGSLIYGPYKDEHGLAEILNIFYQYYFLRRCSKNLTTANNQSCSHFALKQCLGPCREEYEGNYEENLASIIDILEGRGDDILEKIRTKMVKEAERQNFEKAAVCRNDLKYVEHFLRYQQMLSFLMRPEEITAVEETVEGEVKIHRIQKGRLINSAVVVGHGDCTEVIEKLRLFKQKGQDLGTGPLSGVSFTGLGSCPRVLPGRRTTFSVLSDCTCCHPRRWWDEEPIPVSPTQNKWFAKEALDEALIIYQWISRRKFKAVFYG